MRIEKKDKSKFMPLTGQQCNIIPWLDAIIYVIFPDFPWFPWPLFEFPDFPGFPWPLVTLILCVMTVQLNGCFYTQGYQKQKPV